MKAKTTEWKIDDYLKTPEDRAFYLEAAIEEAVRDNDMAFIATALSDVARAIGEGSVASFMAGISAGMSAFTASTPTTALRKATRRERVMA